MAIFGHRGAPPVVVPPSDGHGTGHPLESRQLSATRRLSRSLRRDHRRWCPVAKGAKLVNQKHQLGFVFSFQENLFWKGRNDRINSFFWCESVMMSCDIIALVPLWISLCRTSPRLDFYFTTVSQHLHLAHDCWKTRQPKIYATWNIEHDLIEFNCSVPWVYMSPDTVDIPSQWNPIPVHMEDLWGYRGFHTRTPPSQMLQSTVWMNENEHVSCQQ